MSRFVIRADFHNRAIDLHVQMTKQKRTKRSKKLSGTKDSEMISAVDEERATKDEAESAEAPVPTEESTETAERSEAPENEKDEGGLDVGTRALQLAVLRREIDRLQREKADYREMLSRKQAEFENFRKRTEREKQDFVKFAAAELVREILTVVDNLERAIEASKQTTGAEGSEQQLREGVEIIYRQFRDILGKQGLKEVQALHERFDPHVHEAVSRVETTEHPDETVLEVFQTGYLFGDRLLRPSMVSVASNAATEAEPTSKESDRDEESDGSEETRAKNGHDSDREEEELSEAQE